MIYEPADALGFTAWTDCFDYQNGRLGLSFKEIRRAHDAAFVPPRLEMGEAIGAPVSYCSAECGSADTVSERVYMASDDGGEHWYETGRCPLAEGSFLNAGFADGRLVGLDVAASTPRAPAGATILPSGKARTAAAPGRKRPVCWRAAPSISGGCAACATARFSCLPASTARRGALAANVQRATPCFPAKRISIRSRPFFLHSPDGRSFSGPHYVLPGIGAHEYDAAELSDGRLLFVAGDVQGTPVGRQLVRRSAQGFINRRCCPSARALRQSLRKNPQGGFVPESIVCLPGDVLVGARRGKPLQLLRRSRPDMDGDRGRGKRTLSAVHPPAAGRTRCGLGHCGADSAVGQTRMAIAADLFRLDGAPPAGVSCLLNACFLRTGAITATHIRRG